MMLCVILNDSFSEKSFEAKPSMFRKPRRFQAKIIYLELYRLS